MSKKSKRTSQDIKAKIVAPAWMAEKQEYEKLSAQLKATRSRH